MRDVKRNVILSDEECRIVIRILNDRRTELLQQEMDTDTVNEILMKVINAPAVKGRKERGAYAQR